MSLSETYESLKAYLFNMSCAKTPTDEEEVDAPKEPQMLYDDPEMEEWFRKQCHLRTGQEAD